MRTSARVEFFGAPLPSDGPDSPGWAVSDPRRGESPGWTISSHEHRSEKAPASSQSAWDELRARSNAVPPLMAWD